MANPTIIFDDRTYIYVESVYPPDDQTLPSPVFTIVYRIIRRHYTNVTQANSTDDRVGFTDHDARHMFSLPFHRLAAGASGEAAVADLLSSIDVPFPLAGVLYWKYLRCYSSAAPLPGLADALARVSAFASRMIGAAAPGRRRLRMNVTIENRVVRPIREALRRASVERRSRYAPVRRFEPWRISVIPPDLGESRRLSPLELLNVPVVIPPPPPPPNSVEFLIGIDGSTFSTTLPAARSGVELLEKSRYSSCSDGGGEGSSTLMCVVCMEDVLVGSEITRMPCMHEFHSDCLVKWLETAHTCPICRFYLPTSD